MQFILLIIIIIITTMKVLVFNERRIADLKQLQIALQAPTATFH